MFTYCTALFFSTIKVNSISVLVLFFYLITPAYQRPCIQYTSEVIANFDKCNLTLSQKSIPFRDK